jgi:hypothetical protein
VPYVLYLLSYANKFRFFPSKYLFKKILLQKCHSFIVENYYNVLLLKKILLHQFAAGGNTATSSEDGVISGIIIWAHFFCKHLMNLHVVVVDD